MLPQQGILDQFLSGELSASPRHSDGDGFWAYVRALISGPLAGSGAFLKTGNFELARGPFIPAFLQG